VRTGLLGAACLLFAACSEDERATAGAGVPEGAAALADLAPQPDLAPDLAIVDRDQDGLDDARELAWAAAYLPYLSISPMDGCDTLGILVRVRPHPKNPTRLHVIYDQLYDRDCGLGGHVGDDEVFAATIDPARPPPGGIVALKAISHQGTPCQRVSECGRCMGQTACATLARGEVAWPAVWPSRGKHGSYVNRASTCGAIMTCLDSCDDNPTPRLPPLVNAGEPDHPLVHDLTTDGFITAGNGWKNMELFHFDPWGGKKFGGAGIVSADLVDSAFDTPVCD